MSNCAPALVLVVLFAITGREANAQMSNTSSTGDYATDLGALNGIIKTRGYTRDICDAQFPDLRETIDAAYADWRERYKPFLQEVQLRLNFLMAEDARQRNISLADDVDYLNNGLRAMIPVLKKTFSQNGPEKFRSICQNYAVSLGGITGDIEKRYPEHVATIRRVKLN